MGRYLRIGAALVAVVNLFAASFPAAQAHPVSHAVRHALMPVSNSIVTSAFGPRIHPVTGSRSFHAGVDLSASLNQTVRSVLAGKVIQAGRRGLLGNSVEIVHDGLNISTIYGHLNKVSVKAGQKVARGQKIGLAGSTGRSTGVHLHLTVKDRKTGRVMEPLAFIASVTQRQKSRQARLDKLVVAPARSSLSAARLAAQRLGTVRQLQAELKQSEAMLTLFQSLYDQGIVSRDQRDDRQKAVKQIETSLAAVKSNDEQKMRVLQLQKANDEVTSARAVALDFEKLFEEGAVSRKERSEKMRLLDEAEKRLGQLKQNS